MKTLVRKTKSAFYLLANTSNPLQSLVHHTSKNFRIYIFHNRKKPFIYRSQLKFPFVCLPDSKTSIDLYVRQNYEEVELKIAYNWLQKSDCCLDVGANIGYFSALFAARVGANGKVIAIEASSETVKHLEQTIHTLALPQVYVEQVCVTDIDGYVEFMVCCDGTSDVQQSLRVSPEIEDNFKKERVVSTTLNHLLEKYQISQNVALIKMDIEAAEPLALRGGNLLFNKDALPLFIVEIYNSGLQRLGFEPKDIFSFFPSNLFELYQVNRSYPNPTPEFSYGVVYNLPNPEEYNWPLHTNLIAIPKVGKYSNRKSQIVRYLP